MALSEDDTRVKLIDPRIRECGWQEDYLIRQYPIADDRYYVEGEEYKRLPTRKFADYVLKYKETIIAVLEAKAEDEDPEKHLSQAQDYAQRLDVPFVYISNGKKTLLFDRRTLKSDEVKTYLSPEEIYKVYLGWKGLESTNTNPLNFPLYISGYKKPRAYQETAVKRVIENIVKSNTRTLLTMATGTGKTYIAFQIIWKLLKSKHMHRVLFLTDRIFLKDQAYNEFESFREGSNDARCKIEGGEFNKNRNIYFATYQTLFTNNLYKHIPDDFFDLIVIDECHRSRYGDWGIILDHFNIAYHMGMTATPKREDNIDVYEYFGDPVFEYSLGQAIEDGYLVPYKIYKVTTNLYKEGLNIKQAEEVIYDDEIDPKDIKDYYEPSEYERAVTIPDQINLLSKKVINILDKTNPYGKTIVFCVDMAHAQAVKDIFNQLKGDEDYATRIVAEDKDDMTKFRDKEMPKPIIATTVDLLSTGIDIPHLQNIVFMRPINSRVLFKQIIGRGSRLFEGKGFFRIIDFTDATRLIDEWDIPEEEPQPPVPPEEPKQPFDKLMYGLAIDSKTEQPIDEARIMIKIGRWDKSDFTNESGIFKLFGIPSNDSVRATVDKDGYKKVSKKLKPLKSEGETPYLFSLKPQHIKPKKIKVKGIEVNIEEEIEIEFDGRKLSYAEYRKYSKENILKRVHSTDELRKIWLDQKRKEDFIQQLEGNKINIELIKSIDNLDDSDSFDVIAHLVFNVPLFTREDRVKQFMRENDTLINQYGSSIRETINDLLDKYKYSGEENLSPQVFMLPNMYAKKEAVQKNYPNGLVGFLSFMKEKIYGNFLTT
ncbi:DEAD/DEAH box helicase family protein [Candidatus Roizmanbacteria bacterium]|nr:DEAD/DEAH box helicase family protein [Candidatus Roizmanbacteria bacterium]